MPADTKQLTDLSAIVKLASNEFGKKTTKMDFFFTHHENNRRTIYNIVRSPPGLNLSVTDLSVILQITWSNPRKELKGVEVRTPASRNRNRSVTDWVSDISPTVKSDLSHSIYAFHLMRAFAIYEHGFEIRTRFGPDLFAVISSQLKNSSIDEYVASLGKEMVRHPPLKDGINRNPTYHWLYGESSADQLIKELQGGGKVDVGDLGQNKRKLQI